MADRGSRPNEGFEHKIAHSFKHWVGLLMVLAGMSLLLLPLVLYVQGTQSQRELEIQWEDPPSLKLRRASAGTREPEAGFPVTKLVIPKIGLAAVVVEGTTPESLSRGPGHIPSSAGPGEPGNCCIAGHRNMYGSWFRRLDRLSAKDTVILRGQDTEFVYRVTDKFTAWPDDLSVLEQTSEPTLTLITCTPVPRPTQRLVITAELIRDS